MLRLAVEGSRRAGGIPGNESTAPRPGTLPRTTSGSQDITPPKRVTGFGLDSDNSDPRGMWGNEEHFWVANDGTGSADKLYAYNRSDGSRATSADFDTLRRTRTTPTARSSSISAPTEAMSPPWT